MRFIQRLGAVARLVRSQTRPVTLPVLQLCGGSAHRAGGIGAAATRVDARPPIPCRWLAGSANDEDAGPAVEDRAVQEPDGGACPPGVAVVTSALCQGCGSELHSEDPVRLGYIPPEKLELILLMARRRNADLPATAAAAAPYDPGSALERDRLVHFAGGPQYDDGSEFLLGGMADDGVPGGGSGSGGRGKGAAQKSNIITCARCHDLTFHRGRKTPMLPSDQQPRVDISNAGLVVCVADIFDFSGSLARPLSEAVESASAVLLVLNKVDLLPCDAKRSELKLVQWVREQPEYARLPNTLSVHLVSATSGWGLPRLLRKIHDYCRGNEVSASVVGLTNVGKSSLINRMLGGKVMLTDADDPDAMVPVTTSAIPGTTLGPINFELVRGGSPSSRSSHAKGKKKARSMYLRRAPRATSTAGEAGMNPVLPVTTSATSSVASKKPTRPTVSIEDTPGIYNPGHLTALLTAREHHAVQPRKRVRPRVFTLNPGQSLMFGAVGRFDYVDGSCHAILTVFVADEVKLHQTNIEKAGELLSQLAADNDGGMFPASADDGATIATPRSVALTPPFRGPEDCPFPPLSMVTEHRMMGKGWQRHDSAGDVVLPGIGWISVAVRKRTKISFETRLPEGSLCSVLRSPMPFFYK